MKILNFTAKEILSSLLNKTKTQTIRPAWVESFSTHKSKPARFKVGDKIKLIWNQRSRYTIFCKKCGKPLQEGKFHSAMQHYVDYQCKNLNFKNSFNKFINEVEITQFFKIKIGKTKLDSLFYLPYLNKYEMAKLDGFNSIDDMFNFFNKKYDLSQPKEFWVYRWRWLL